MKKSKIIASALIAATVAMGSGYAAWNDTLNVTSTASTGNLNVEFTTASSTCPMDIKPYVFGLEYGNANYLDKDILGNKKEVNVTLNNLYPGAGMLYGAQFKNTGSIPAIIDNVEVQIPNDSFSSLMKDNLLVVGGFVQTGSHADGGVFPKLSDVIFNNSKNYKLKDLETNLNNMLKGKKMMPNDVITLDLPDQESKDQVAKLLTDEQIDGFDPAVQNCIIMGLPKSVSNDLMSKDLSTDQYAKKTLNFKIIFHFKQFNK